MVWSEFIFLFFFVFHSSVPFALLNNKQAQQWLQQTCLTSSTTTRRTRRSRSPPSPRLPPPSLPQRPLPPLVVLVGLAGRLVEIIEVPARKVVLVVLVRTNPDLSPTTPTKVILIHDTHTARTHTLKEEQDKGQREHQQRTKHAHDTFQVHTQAKKRPTFSLYSIYTQQQQQVRTHIHAQACSHSLYSPCQHSLTLLLSSFATMATPRTGSLDKKK